MSTTVAEADNTKALREVAGVFFEADSLEQAIARLKKAGFGLDRIGMLAHNEAISNKLAHLYEEVGGTTDSEDPPEFRYVEKRSSKSSANSFLGGLGVVTTAAASGVIVASSAIVGGPVGAALAGTAVVGGIGALTGTVISESDSDRLQSHLEKGHLLLFARAHNASEESIALEIMNQFGGVDIGVVKLPRKDGEGKGDEESA